MEEKKNNITGMIKGLLRTNKMAAAGGLLVILLVLVAVLAPAIARVEPTEQDLSNVLQGPSRSHWLGTDELGRDVFARMVFGSRISLSVGMVAVIIELLIGILLGALAGYFGGWIDMMISRFIDIMMCIPDYFLILALIVYLGPSIYNIMIVIGLTSWTGLARLVRAEFLSLKNREYVVAAKAAGASHGRIIFRHILPNALSPVFVSAIFGVAGAILLESGLSFLGLGVQPPMASWGSILTSGKDYIDSAWWLTAFPGLAIFVTVMSYNMLGQGLRDALDPRLKEQ
jgi:peptide/nickel transport system permease protein